MGCGKDTISYEFSKNMFDDLSKITANDFIQDNIKLDLAAYQ